MHELLRISGVSKSFDRHGAPVPVFENISLSVAEGEIVAVVCGPGHGKSTLIGLACGTLRPDRGSVLLNGVDVAQVGDRDVARLLAEDVGCAKRGGPALNTTAAEYVESALGAVKHGRRRRWGRRDQRSMAAAILEELGIAECGAQRWDELSDWQRVLVELAQAACVDPRMLLIDDLARDFGLGQKQALMDVLEGLVDDRRCGVLMAVSDHASALRSVRIWQVHRHGLRLMADHTSSGGKAKDAAVIPIEGLRSDAG
jgi:putative ABC transport system ATP-binding protein